MKFPVSQYSGRSWRGRRFTRGFTMTEIMVSSALMTLVIGGLLVSHFFGMRMYGISKVKLGASDDARKAVSLLISEIRSAKVLKIGAGELGSFTEVPIDTPQIANAIQIYPSSDTNSFVRYYWDSGDKSLKRTTNGSTAMSIVAASITNGQIFTSEDYAGNILTNNQNNRVIGLTLQFYQLQYPSVPIGPGHHYDFYQLRTKITRRTLE